MMTIIDGTPGNDTLTGGIGDDTINGLAGNDQLSGSFGNDVLNGGDGSDTLNGDSGNDTLNGGAHNDILNGGDGNDTLIGGSGYNVFNGGDGHDVLIGGDDGNGFGDTSGGNTITGGNGVDSVTVRNEEGIGNQINTGAGDDEIIVYEGGRDTIDAGSGNDVIHDFGGSDSINGGDGNDVIISTDDSPSFVDGNWVGEVNDTLIGGDGDDYIEDTKGSNKIDAGAGNDMVAYAGWGGADAIDLGTGNDTINNLNSMHATVITTGSGQDKLNLSQFDTSADNLTRITDFATGANGDVVDLTSALNSIVTTGWDGASNPFGAASFLKLTQVGDDVVLQLDADGGGNDWINLLTFEHKDVSQFTSDNFYPPIQLDGSAIPGQTLDGTPGDDTLTGGMGGDTINGFAGNDHLSGSFGNDVLNGGDGSDTLNGDSGNDTLNGGAHNDLLFGGDGNDTVIGDSGYNVLSGGAGDDVLIGGDDGNGFGDTLGSNTITGGNGNDSVTIRDDDGLGDHIDTGAGDDEITVYETGGDTIDAGSGNDVIQDLGGDDSLNGGDGNDVIRDSSGSDTINGGDGNDYIEDSAGSNKIDAGAGDDDLAYAGRAGADTIDLGAGNDTINYLNSIYATVITTGTGQDRLKLTDFDTIGNNLTRITDFAAGANGDVIDLTTVLDSIAATGWDGASNPFGSAGFLKLTQVGHDVVLQLDADGGGNNWINLLTFQHTNVSQFTSDNFFPPIEPNANHAPALTGMQASLAGGSEDTAYIISAAQLLQGFSDVDGDTLSVSGLTANHGSLVYHNGTWTFTPEANYHGSVTLSYSVTDGHGGSIAASQSFSLAAVNDAPIVANPIADTSASANASFSYQFGTTAFADVDAGDSLSYAAALSDGSSLPGWLRFDPATRTFSGTPGTADAGALDIRVTATDTSGAHISDIFVLTISSAVMGNDPVLTGTAGDDTVIGTSADHMQTLNGLDGYDTIRLASGGGFANGGAGNDNLLGGNSTSSSHFTGNMLNDYEGDNIFHGGNAGSLATVQNLISAGQGNDMAYGGNATGSGAFVYNLMQMGDGANHVWGGNASGGATLQNFVFGGSGNDTFVAGVAADGASHVYNLMAGNGGSDVFVLKPGSDQTTITDFSAGTGAGHDVLDLSAYVIPNVASVLAAATESGGTTVLHLASDHGTMDDLVLTGVAKSDLVAADFVI